MATSYNNNRGDVTITPHDKGVLECIFNPGLPYGDSLEEENIVEEKPEEDSENVRQAKELEIRGVQAAEAEDLDMAVRLFDQAVEVAPEWPSTYNNRAQVRRLKHDIEGAKSDLDRALQLSDGKGTAACQAFTQRGLLRKREGDDDGAREDLTKAAALGNAFAKQLLIAMNPYAALCNQMLSDVMRKIRTGEGES